MELHHQLALNARPNPRRVLRQLEREFGLDKGSLAMYCTPYGMGQKLAEIRVVHNEGVSTLAQVDDDDKITGGHLEAQMLRFRNLWRASLFAAPDTIETLTELDLLDDLGDAFHAVSRVRDDYNSTRMMSLISLKLRTTLEDLYGERDIIREPRADLAARGYDGILTYPSGVASVEAFFAEAPSRDDIGKR